MKSHMKEKPLLRLLWILNLPFLCSVVSSSLSENYNYLLYLFIYLFIFYIRTIPAKIQPQLYLTYAKAVESLVCYTFAAINLMKKAKAGLWGLLSVHKLQSIIKGRHRSRSLKQRPQRNAVPIHSSYKVQSHLLRDIPAHITVGLCQSISITNWIIAPTE